MDPILQTVEFQIKDFEPPVLPWVAMYSYEWLQPGSCWETIGGELLVFISLLLDSICVRFS